MIEGFTTASLDALIGQASLMNDLELQSYLGSLSSTDRASFVSSQVSGAITSVSGDKESMFLDNADKLKGADRNVEAAMYYLARTKDLHNLASDADDVTSSQLNILNVNSDLSVRQNEINEWSNQNKLDTLFFLQILFTGLCFIAFVLFLKVSGIITHTVFLMLTIVTGIFIVLTLILRYRFTAINRDSRYWHKSRFPGQADKNKAQSSSGSCPS